MGRCNQRLFLFTICTLQLISIIERQVFDLLGYQWLPIAANFLHIIFVIIGFFGGYQYRKSYLISYNVWQILWLAWNAFIVCLYLDVGMLNKDGEILNLGTGAASWWEVNGIGCRPYFSVNASFGGSLNDQLEDFLRPPRPDLVDGCLLDYHLVEVIHAAIQLTLSVCGVISAGLIIQIYKPEDDIYVPKPRSRATSLYSVQYSSTRGRSSPLEDELELNVNQLNSLASNDPNRPMTPRRVKRRSVSRGSGRHSRSSSRNRNSTYSNGLVNEGYSGTMASAAGTQSRHRESQRKKRYVNPVNRLMDDSSTSTDSVPAYFPSCDPNGYLPVAYPPPPTVRPPTSRPPALLPHSGSSNHAGHSNPMYQSSRPNSVYSISAQVDMESRPPSAHSSYSNWHGQRPSMPLPAVGGGHHSANLHGHSPTPSGVGPTNTFGVPTAQAAAVSSGYNRSCNYYNSSAGLGHGHYG